MNGTSPLKFVLLSGHDTTFIPFMAAVAPNAWDQTWPPYATLSTIELLRVGASGNSSEGGETEDAAEDDGDFYFRFVYNGEVLKLDGCDQGKACRKIAHEGGRRSTASSCLPGRGNALPVRERGAMPIHLLVFGDTRPPCT